MASLSTTPNHFADDMIWNHLKQAIAASSGFQRWRADRSITDSDADSTLDQLVNRYLRETLETLAY
ncbi:hypothetical protein [Thermocoleostomius sinensis]|jgi:hypothetical protein|uniref:Uncharacterized protein n=1 Tax=Thermocoleostomius sinensis A174 TaxID=2016057 RepID=A0A9E9CAT6_9CYAN|nr:hypothetical protein [Thermocoleostomius sinensis]WAL61412.1 hypothetical protein OXH18_05315 [Thermocoleostomius sinensis A174]